MTLGIVRWAPWLMMLVADVFPGSCCGGAHRPRPPLPPPTTVTSVNKSSTQPICHVEWQDEANPGAPDYHSFDPDVRIPPGGGQ